MIREDLFNIQQALKSNKDNYNEFGKFKYRNLENILADLKPLLKLYQCTITFNDEIINVGAFNYIKSTATLTDKEGKEISTTAFAKEDETRAGMSNGQMTGCASSYSRKYAICGLFAINEEKDLDALDNTTKAPQYNKSIDNLEWTPQHPTEHPITIPKDNLTILKDFCHDKKQDTSINKEELKKFFRYYEGRANSWRGKFNVNDLFTNWMSKAAA